MMKIEKVLPEDAKALLEIYALYVRDTAVSFEYEVPSEEEFRNRIVHISSKYPYIKAVDEAGEIAGYAYAAEFKGRSAYDWSVETTIYIRESFRQQGIGRLLYERLEEMLQQMGVLNMNACIAAPKEESVYLTDDSIRFHHKMGFTDVGVFHDSGYKFRQWFDMIWMEKMIGTHEADQPQVRFGMF